MQAPKRPFPLAAVLRRDKNQVRTARRQAHLRRMAFGRLNYIPEYELAPGGGFRYLGHKAVSARQS